MSKTPGHEDGLLTFDWPSRQRSSGLLTGLIFLSIIVHLMVFFVFQITPPTPAQTPKVAPPVGLLTRFDRDGKRSAENEMLLNWIAAHDPSLATRTSVAMPAGVLDVPYRPSYLIPRTAPLGLPAEAATVQFPSPKPPLELIEGSKKRIIPAVESQPALQTTLRFGSSIAALTGLGNPSPPEFKSPTPLQASSFLVGIGDSGKVLYIFPQSGSGSNEADIEASAYVRALKFKSSDVSVTWGMIDVQWGDAGA